MAAASTTRYLITGGAGFIGSHLAERLLGDGHRVTALDDLSTGTKANILHLASNPRFQLVVGSILDRSLVETLVDDCDFVVHLAAAVGVQLIVDRPVHTILTNVNGSESVLSAAAAVKRPLLIASTSEVYGKSTKLPFSEEDDLVVGPTTRSRWAYACSKAIDEFLAMAYYREEDLPVVVVRLFNTVGPRQTDRYGMVVPRFVKQALQGEPLTVYGDGRQTRCFAYVGDVVGGIAQLTQEPRAYGQVFNLGNDIEMSVRDLAEMVLKVTGSKSSIEFLPYEAAYGSGFEDMRRRVPNLDKIREFIGYRPRVDPQQVVELVVHHFRKTSPDYAAAMPANGAGK